jgi:predicted trehalose synthase
VQRDALSPEVARGFAGAATVALGSLHARIARLSDSGGLGRRSVPDATWEFHALCEGLAALELRCNLPPAHAQQLWTDALSALLAGWRL